MLASNDFRPTAPVHGVPLDVQADSMRDLHRMSVAPEHPHELADQMVAWASSNSLSRADMAVATGLSVDEVRGIIRETAERDQDMTTRALRERAARHLR